jgi:ketosteroid isomerase-like protein
LRAAGGPSIRARVDFRPMGAVDTMEEFFEKLNEGDRPGAVALMDERVEMRIHVGDNARTLRGVEQVGGWFLRAEPGLKMIPGDVRDLGITYQADVLSVRPGAPSQHLDASFRVEAGKITSINLAPR